MGLFDPALLSMSHKRNLNPLETVVAFTNNTIGKQFKYDFSALEERCRRTNGSASWRRVQCFAMKVLYGWQRRPGCTEHFRAAGEARKSSVSLWWGQQSSGCSFTPCFLFCSFSPRVKSRNSSATSCPAGLCSLKGSCPNSWMCAHTPPYTRLFCPWGHMQPERFQTPNKFLVLETWYRQLRNCEGSLHAACLLLEMFQIFRNEFLFGISAVLIITSSNLFHER